MAWNQPARFHPRTHHGTALLAPLAETPQYLEVVVHCAYWKYVVRRRLTGEKHGSFPLKGSNFFLRPEVRTDAAWKKDLLLLDEMHELLVEKVSILKPEELTQYPNGSQFTNLQTISGIAMHDVYHAGQIQLLKRLQR